MLYLIKSLKWTNHYNKDTYWGPEQNGYTSVIAYAGFYEKKEAEKIVRLSSGNAEMIPATREIIDKANRQLKRLKSEINHDRLMEEDRYKRAKLVLDKREDKVADAQALLNNILGNLSGNPL